MDPPAYHHIQRGPLYLFPLLPGLVLLVVAVATASGGLDGGWPLAWLLFGGGGLLSLNAACFTRITITGDHERLRVAFGVVPLFFTSFAYADLEAVEVDRTRIIDGWGIHWLPGRGWTWNLWGRSCVRIRHRGHTVRIGTDDAGALQRFLSARLRPGSAGAGPRS
jgi:hypothetical protein